MDLILSAEVTSTSSSCFHLGVLKPRQHSVNGEYRHSKLSLIITSTSVCCRTPHPQHQGFIRTSIYISLHAGFIRSKTSYIIQDTRSCTSLLLLVFTQQVGGWAAPVILFERPLPGKEVEVDWLKKNISNL